MFLRDSKDATTLIESAHATIRDHERTQHVLDASDPASRGDYSVPGSGDEKRLAHLTFLPVVISR